jgi:hypothetical protein
MGYDKPERLGFVINGHLLHADNTTFATLMDSLMGTTELALA